MKTLHSILYAVIMCTIAQVCIAQESINLSGTWSFQLDNEKAGERERWYVRDLKETIKLPGSTDEKG